MILNSRSKIFSASGGPPNLGAGFGRHRIGAHLFRPIPIRTINFGRDSVPKIQHLLLSTLRLPAFDWCVSLLPAVVVCFRHTMMMMRHRKKADRLARSIFDSYSSPVLVVDDHDAGHAFPRRRRTIVVATAAVADVNVLRAGTTIATTTASRHSMATTMKMTNHCCHHRQSTSRWLCSSTAGATTNHKSFRDFVAAGDEKKSKNHDDHHPKQQQQEQGPAAVPNLLHDDDGDQDNKNHNNNNETTTTVMMATTAATATTTTTTKRETFGSMLRTYGPVFLGTYVAVYLTTLSALYAGVASGALDPVALFSTLGITSSASVAAVAGDGNGLLLLPPTTSVELVYNFLSHYEWTRSYAHYVPDYPAVANFGVAWIAAKFTEPLRIPIAIGLTPRVAQSLGYHSRRQPPPPPQQQQHSPSLVVKEEKDEKHGQVGEKKP
jgi:Protein of unknown function (DUF1279)